MERKDRFLVPAASSTSCVTLGESFLLFGPWCPHRENEFIFSLMVSELTSTLLILHFYKPIVPPEVSYLLPNTANLLYSLLCLLEKFTYYGDNLLWPPQQGAIY